MFEIPFHLLASVRSISAKYISPVAMALRTVHSWIVAREKDIERAFSDKEICSALDEVIHEHNYSFKSIAAWPLDACVVYAPTRHASLILGSLQAACNLKDIERSLGRKVNIVVTMCENEMKVAGAPADWTAYFHENKAMTMACLHAWRLICRLWKASVAAVVRDYPMHILFHCFGGINRSAAILCAWLIIAYDYTAEEAIDLLLSKRPSLRPWRQRSYVLDALYCVELARGQWRTAFATSDFEFMTWSD